MKNGKNVIGRKEASDHKERRKAFVKEFTWDREKNTICKAIKEAIASYAMTAPDPDAQYYLAVDVSKKGLRA